ncbi:MAG: hypothetical protein R3F65_16820 [bacterium]
MGPSNGWSTPDHWESSSSSTTSSCAPAADRVGTSGYQSFHRISEYLHVASILYLLNDRLIPRDLARLEATAYAEVINLIRPPT